MRAFHSFWSKPNTVRNEGCVEYPDFEVLTTILSALKWREHNGTIRMITDTVGAEYFARIGIDSVWDEISTELDAIDPSVDPLYFWAAGKLFALRNMEIPCVMLDTDLVIWQPLSIPEDCDIMAAHYEELYPDVYPDPREFRLKPGYTYPDDWDFDQWAANTAFLYLRNEEFRDYYVKEAVSFLRGVETEELNPITAMCCAEQRILPMCAQVKDQRIRYLIDIAQPNQQRIVTHTWGFKDIMRSSSQAREEFCVRCVHRILQDYPEKQELLSGRSDLRHYMETALRLYR